MEKYRQDGQYYQPVSIGEILARNGNIDMLPISIHKSISKQLKTNLIIPPKYQAYSLAIEYITDWFYKKFPDHFFHHKYLDASHIMDQFRKLRTRDLIVINKPAGHIAVDEDTEFNRNNIDLYNLGVTLYSNRAMIKDSFFLDRDKNIYISFVPRQIKLNFNFSIRVTTKAIQDDVAEICDMVFRANGSQKHYVDADFPIPKELIGQLACDLGMCDENHKYDVYKMLSYLNKHSKMAFLYKFNAAINGMDYFIRVPRCLVHIRTSSISKDQAVYRNMSATDFVIRFSAEVRFPALKFFVYYSMKERESIHSLTRLDARSFLYGVTNLYNVPNTNEKGWLWNFKSDYTLENEEELYCFKNKKLMKIDISHIEGEIRDVIEYTKSIALNPGVFIDIKAFNYLHYLPLEVNWEKMEIVFLEPWESLVTHFYFYIDNEYLHNTLRLLKKYDDYRMIDVNTNIGPEKNIQTKLPNTGEIKKHN